jgi:hypothetical protein
VLLAAWCGGLVKPGLRFAPGQRERRTRARARRTMTFFDLCVAVLLFFNSAAVLNEHRFLAKRASGHATPHANCWASAALFSAPCAGGWYAQDFTSGGGPGAPSSLKGQALGIITAVSYMRSECKRAKRCSNALTKRAPAVPLVVINVLVIFVKLVFG